MDVGGVFCFSGLRCGLSRWLLVPGAEMGVLEWLLGFGAETPMLGCLLVPRAEMRVLEQPRAERRQRLGSPGWREQLGKALKVKTSSLCLT